MNRKSIVLTSLAMLGVALTTYGLARHHRSSPELADFRQEVGSTGVSPEQKAKEVDASRNVQLEQLGYLGAQPAAAVSAPMPALQAEATKPPEPASPTSGDVVPAVDAAKAQPYLIRNARVALEVDDVRERASGIAETVKSAGGYISNMNDATTPLGEPRVIMEIRVPSTALDTVLGRLEGWSKVLSREVTAQDVTQEYTDTDARSRNLKKTEERLLEHLGRSATLENTLKLEAEVSRVREQIEVLDGRLRYLNNRVSLSTLQLTIVPTPKAQAIAPPETFSTAHEFTNAAREVVAFGQTILAHTIWLGVWGVVWGPIALIALWLTRVAIRSGLVFRMLS